MTRYVLLCSCLCVLGGAGCANFHEASPGALYRSGQLSAKQFDRYVRKHAIRTVINLRGASPNAGWYQDELAVMRKDSLFHYDFSLSASRYVAPATMDSILAICAGAPRPVLVHCMGGADRTGLFCAAWRLAVDSVAPREAAKQLSFVYGHVPWFKNGTAAMDSSFRDYVRHRGRSPAD